MVNDLAGNIFSYTTVTCNWFFSLNGFPSENGVDAFKDELAEKSGTGIFGQRNGDATRNCDYFFAKHSSAKIFSKMLESAGLRRAEHGLGGQAKGLGDDLAQR